MLPERVDIHIGHQIQARRVKLGLSEEHLANTIGASVNELRSWEVGGNRVAASTLLALATALNVGMSYFFEGLPIVSGGDVNGENHDQNSDTVENGDG